MKKKKKQDKSKYRLVTIKDDYIKYLRRFSKNIRYNKNEKRPHIGVVFKINNQNYFAPLGSPKVKHENMKDNLDFLKIDNGKLGVINLNNMIPVPSNYVKKMKFSKVNDEKYKKLLKKQTIWLKKNSLEINKNAEKLYSIITTKENTIFHKRSHNFSLLEEKSLEYTKILEIKQQQQQIAFDPLTGNKLIVEKGYKIPEKEVNQWITKNSVEKNNLKVISWISYNYSNFN